jgi:hypothetical protein
MREQLDIAVFSAGALGDFVLTWPLLRAMRSSGQRVGVIAPSERAALAAAELGIIGLPAERPWVNALWREEVGPAAFDQAPLCAGVVCFAGETDSETDRAWRDRAGRHLRASREALWREFDVAGRGGAPPRPNDDGAIVLHIGAGSRAKMWPPDRWCELAAMLGETGAVELIAGEVELERLSTDERRRFESAGGVHLRTLSELRDRLAAARAFIGADTGPTHLSAQLGVRTLALFGPTDPGIWSPVGPRVRVERAADGDLARLAAEQVRASLNIMLAGGT